MGEEGHEEEREDEEYEGGPNGQSSKYTMDQIPESNGLHARSWTSQNQKAFGNRKNIFRLHFHDVARNFSIGISKWRPAGIFPIEQNKFLDFLFLAIHESIFRVLSSTLTYLTKQASAITSQVDEM